MKQPNILFLFTDDQRFDTIHALGNEQIHTPNFDYLVENGTAFTHAAIMGGTSPAVCMPNRAMMLTGRTLFHIEGRGESIPANHTTMPEHFRTIGYETFGTGKWHNGSESYARSFNSGAEIFFGGMDDHWQVPVCNFAADGNYPAPRLYPVHWLPWEQSETHKQFDHITPGKHSSELFADATCEFLHSHDKNTPFFAYVSFMAPHDPRTMPQAYLNMYDHSVRVPLIMMGPGIPSGEQRDAFCYLIDIFPTLCELTGHGIPVSVEGVSLVPTLQDTAVSPRPHLHFAYTDCQRGVKNGRYKLIETVFASKKTTQLFDCQNDPWENNNLANNPIFAQTMAQLRHELKRWRTEMGDWSDTFWKSIDEK